MKIKKIKWNGRVEDQTHMSEKTGTNFIWTEAEVYSGFGRIHPDDVMRIEEQSPRIYNLYFRNGNMLRILDPIEVYYEE